MFSLFILFYFSMLPHFFSSDNAKVNLADMFNIKNGANVFYTWRHHQVPFSRFLKIVLSYWKRIYTCSRSSKRKCVVVMNCIANYSIALLCMKPKWPIAATQAFWLFSIRRKENYGYGKLRTIIEKKLLRDGKGEILIFKILEIYQWVFCALNLPRRHFLNVFSEAIFCSYLKMSRKHGFFDCNSTVLGGW